MYICALISRQICRFGSHEKERVIILTNDHRAHLARIIYEKCVPPPLSFS